MRGSALCTALLAGLFGAAVANDIPVTVDRRGFFIEYGEGEKVDHHEAEERCRRQGRKLAELREDNEVRVLSRVMSDHRREIDSDWAWIKDWRGDDFRPRCVALHDNGKVSDKPGRDCKERGPYICEDERR